MELEQLRIFAAVAREGSFTRGAKKLYISHSTTSRAVAALEEELGVTLFERSNRILGLSPAGETLLAEAEALLARAEAIRAKVKGNAEA
ncbi:MAG: LysR family transcriptional regulator [Oscillospiraceae bacterium]|nr:LysR family transcriptional regulator [Oscillospiraceae bacterium]